MASAKKAVLFRIYFCLHQNYTFLTAKRLNALTDDNRSVRGRFYHIDSHTITQRGVELSSETHNLQLYKTITDRLHNWDAPCASSARCSHFFPHTIPHSLSLISSSESVATVSRFAATESSLMPIPFRLHHINKDLILLPSPWHN